MKNKHPVLRRFMRRKVSVVAAAVLILFVLIAEASLSFLGAGIPSPYPSWGGMLNEARGYVYMGWWMIVFPAIFTALSVLGFNLFGDGLRDLIDPLSGR